MATNHVDRSNRSKRRPKGLDDFVCSKSQTNEHTPCNNCSDTFPTKKALLQHQKQCTLRPTKGASFFNVLPKSRSAATKNPVPVNEKILPSSQPMQPATATPTRTYAATAKGTTTEASTTSIPTLTPTTPQPQPPTTSTPPSTATTTATESPSNEEAADQEPRPNLPQYNEITRIPTTACNGFSGQTLVETIDNIYEMAVKWRKNHFQIPTGKSGKQ